MGLFFEGYEESFALIESYCADILPFNMQGEKPATNRQIVDLFSRPS